mmetsp:Transcript_18916/g.54793  ORF Transcript_18916/g.54793 Transcript_18916/m.54793 type:complete len:106 (-) Transcript_18916:103-420(-)
MKENLFRRWDSECWGKRERREQIIVLGRIVKWRRIRIVLVDQRSLIGGEEYDADIVVGADIIKEFYLGNSGAGKVGEWYSEENRLGQERFANGREEARCRVGRAQ